MRRKRLIAQEYRDSDGYWINLHYGWRVRGDAHSIVENTKREAYAKLADVVMCSCDECLAGLKKEAAWR
jgi:hypothetical protein